MKRGFHQNVVQQRHKLQVTEDTLKERINNSPFGEKTKALARKWGEYESFGSVGWGIFDVTPVIERAQGAYLYDVDGKAYLDLLAGFSVSTLKSRKINPLF